MNWNVHELASFAEQVTRTAGKRIVELRQTSSVAKSFKHAGELVTSADLESDRIIRDAIEQCYPNHRILSEERVVPLEDAGFDGPVWVVDPLDGTVNYSRHLSHFGVSLAFAVDGIVLVGAVHAPDLNLTYIGIRHEGSFCNGERMKVRDAFSLSDAVVGTGFPHDKSLLLPAQSTVTLLTRHCRDIRRFAAPTVDICYVASGRLDAHTESLRPWDVAAAGLIAREAGALMGHRGDVPREVPIELFGDNVLYAAPGIFQELLNVLRSAP
jgi:myo-inositol-1(or 4)-monophosphatase